MTGSIKEVGRRRGGRTVAQANAARAQSAHAGHGNSCKIFAWSGRPRGLGAAVRGAIKAAFHDRGQVLGWLDVLPARAHEVAHCVVA